MNLLRIQIPLAATKEELPATERVAREQAAMDELMARIPGLARLQGSVPSLSLRAIGDQLHLCITLEPHPQLQLDLADWRHIPGRLVELDPTLLDQQTITQSVRLTRMLLARANRREPQALKEVADALERQLRKRAARQLRRALGQCYSIQVLGQEERIQLPLFQTLAVEHSELHFSLQVTAMRQQSLFKARRIHLLGEPVNGPHFAPSKTEVYVCSRISEAGTYTSGQVLHRSMELRHLIFAVGRLVVETTTQDVVALEISAVALHALDLPKS